MSSKPSLSHTLLTRMALVALVAVLVLGLFWGWTEYRQSLQTAQAEREDLREQAVEALKHRVEDAVEAVRAVRRESAWRTEAEIKQAALERLRQLDPGGSRYLFVGRWDGLSLLGPAAGQNVYDIVDQDGVKVVQELIRLAKQGGGVLHYVLPDLPGQRPAPKISYVTGIPDWQWYIGSGRFIDEIEARFETRRAEIRRTALWRLAQVAVACLALMGAAYLVMRRVARRAEANHRRFAAFFAQAAEDLRPIDPEQLDFAEYQDIARAANRMIVARRKLEADLRRSEHSLAEAQRIGRMGNWSWHVETGSVSWSDEVYRLFGRDPETFTPSYGKVLEAVVAEDRDAFEGAINKALAGEAPYSLDCRVQLPDGTIRWIHGEARVSREEAGDGTILVGTVQDISERKEAEQRLQRTVDELVRANVELERFAYVASHDLQEPLRNIVTYSQRLERETGDRLTGEQREYMTFILGGAMRMRLLVQDLLAYSRVSAGGKAFHRVRTGDVVPAVLRSLQDAIDEAGAQVVVVDDLPTVQGDEVQLALVFSHLLDNALRYRRADVEPLVSVEVASSDGEWVFSVADNGPGIEPAYQERVFEVFRRLDPNHSRPGSGVGLALCRRIVERHGGRIWVESTAGEGSTFFFSLPKV